jgi:hypothetical protein
MQFLKDVPLMHDALFNVIFHVFAKRVEDAKCKREPTPVDMRGLEAMSKLSSLVANAAGMAHIVTCITDVESKRNGRQHTKGQAALALGGALKDELVAISWFMHVTRKPNDLEVLEKAFVRMGELHHSSGKLLRVVVTAIEDSVRRL